MDKIRILAQGCQMLYSKTKNQDLGKFWRVLKWKTMVHFKGVWSILQPFGILGVWPFGIFLVSWYIFPRMLYREKSGNPGLAFKKQSATLLFQFSRHLPS
jgi:hypothetical protein